MSLANHTMFISYDGSVKGVGRNSEGQLGLGDNTNPITTITEISNISNVKQIACGSGHTMFLMNDGTVKGVGANNTGQLGLGHTTLQTTIQDVKISNVKQIACGLYHTMFLMNDDTVKGVGYNSNGQLGLGNATLQTTIRDVNISNVKQIACGSGHTMFLMNDGTVKGVGLNSNGQLGIGNTTTQYTTIQDIPISNVKQISCGDSYTMFLMNDGTVKGVGDNIQGQLGLGNTTTQYTTIQNVNIFNVKQIACGGYYTMFLMNDGTVKGVGYNNYGQLGLNNTTNQSTIQDIPISDVKQISCGGRHTMFLMNDGTVKGVGYNFYGQLGIENTTDQSSIIDISIDSKIRYIAESFDVSSIWDYKKYLVISQNTIKYLSNDVWVTLDVPISSINSTHFREYGLNSIPKEKIKELQYPIQILTWVDDGIYKDTSVNYNILRPDKPKIELETQEFLPCEKLDNLELLTYVDDKNENPKLANILETESKIRFLVSKDGVNYQYYRNDVWDTSNDIMVDGMTKSELESISKDIWSDWFNREAYKNKFDIKIGIYDEILESPIIRDISVNYASNMAPIISNAKITPDSIHTEFCRVSASLHDYEGDSMEYRVLIKKANTEEFVVADDWRKINGNNSDIVKAYNKPYFNLGDNVIKLEVKDQRGAILEWTGNLVMTNQKPIMTYSYDSYGFSATLEDPDIDEVSIQVLINDKEVLPYTPYMSTPRRFSYEWDTEYTPFGVDSKITINVKDTFDGIITEEFTVKGAYKNLMFLDNKGNYYTSDRGEVLQWLEIPNLVAGQNSDPVRVTLLNLTNTILSKVGLVPETKYTDPIKQLPDNVMVKMSKSNDPFIPNETLLFDQDIHHGETKDFYVAIHSKPGRGVVGGEFAIKAEGTIKS